MGGVRKPLGFDLLAEYPDIKNYATVAILIGLVALLRAYYLVRRKEKRERTEREKKRDSNTPIYSLIYYKEPKELKISKTTKSK